MPWGHGFFSLFWTIRSLTVPNLYVNIFNDAKPEVLEIAPAIIRCYALSFRLLPLNISSTYCFQALMKPGTAFIVLVVRDDVISGILIFLLPAEVGSGPIWFATPMAKLFVAICATTMMARHTKHL